MKSPTQYTFACFLISVLFFASCQRPSPIEFQTPQQSQILDVETITGGSIFDNEADSTGLVTADKTPYFGHLILSGVRFDGPNESHTLSLARAVFLNKSQPILLSGRTEYRSMDIGSVYIDGLPLYKVPRRIRVNTPGGPQDTLTGAQYTLVNIDDVGGRGFTYFYSHMYEWTNAGTSPVTLNIRTLSAQGLRITKPTPQDIILQRRDLLVEWIGGEETINLIISIHQTGRQVWPILRMRIRGYNRHVTIPAEVLELLQTNREYVFTFVSQVRSEAQVPGFPDPVLVYCASIHNILVNIRQ